MLILVAEPKVCRLSAGERWIRTSGSAREALSRFDLLRRHLLRKGRCAHEEHYIFPMRTPTTHRSRPKARPSYGSRDPSPRRDSAALPIGILALVFAMVGAIAVRAEVISVPSTDPPSSAASFPPPTVLRGSPPNTARSVLICPPGYTLSPGYGCIGPSSNDYTEGWPGYGYWPDYGYGYPFSGFPGLGFGAGRFHHFAGFPGLGFGAGRFHHFAGFPGLGFGAGRFHHFAGFPGLGFGAGRFHRFAGFPGRAAF